MKTFKAICMGLLASALNAHTSSYTPIFSGYLKSEYWFDSRQIAGIRENEYCLYPLNKVYDAFGHDINSSGQTNMSIIQSRLRCDFSAPSIRGIIPKAVAEADFFGIGTTLPVLRPRHIYTTIALDALRVVAGHTWHPLFIPECCPETINFNTGAPIEVFARQSQIKVGIDYKGLQLFGIASAQLETTSNGPFGPSANYLKNGMIPNLHAQCIYTHEKKAAVGTGIDFLRIVPRITTLKNEYAQEHVTALRAMAFAKIIYKKQTFKVKGIYAQNGHDLTMLGGYGVTYINPVTDHRTYTPTRTVSVWAEWNRKGIIEPGLFIGWTKNHGTRKQIIKSLNTESLLYTRNSDIDSIVRVSPRVRISIKPYICAFEVEYTRAHYGTINNYARACNTTGTTNIRLIASLFYTF